MFVVSCGVLIECAFMTEAAWRSLYVSFAYKHASLICTSLSRSKAVHKSGVYCTHSCNIISVFYLNCFLIGCDIITLLLIVWLIVAQL